MDEVLLQYRVHVNALYLDLANGTVHFLLPFAFAHFRIFVKNFEKVETLEVPAEIGPTGQNDIFFPPPANDTRCCSFLKIINFGVKLAKLFFRQSRQVVHDVIFVQHFWNHLVNAHHIHYIWWLLSIEIFRFYCHHILFLKVSQWQFYLTLIAFEIQNLMIQIKVKVFCHLLIIPNSDQLLNPHFNQIRILKSCCRFCSLNIGRSELYQCYPLTSLQIPAKQS